MNKQNLDINKLRIASPCSATWENMRGNDKTRFCELCNLNVYNLSNMTTGEIQNLLAKTEGRLCARIYKRTDGTVITQDCPVGIRAYYKRTARFAGAALGTILGLFSISFAQSTSKKGNKTISASEVKTTRTINQSKESLLRGTIADMYGAVIPGVELTLSRENSKDFIKVVSDENGEYIFSLLQPGIYHLKAKISSFKELEIINLEIKGYEKSELNITLEPSSESVIMGVVTEDTLLVDTTSSEVTTKITRRMMDSIPH